jgi:hypothetical protein
MPVFSLVQHGGRSREIVEAVESWVLANKGASDLRAIHIDKRMNRACDTAKPSN